jgi:hypothetical protein
MLPALLTAQRRLLQQQRGTAIAASVAAGVRHASGGAAATVDGVPVQVRERDRFSTTAHPTHPRHRD